MATPAPDRTRSESARSWSRWPIAAGAAVKERILLLARGEAAAPHRLGVAIAPPRVARRLRSAVGLPERDGLLVRAVEDGGPAAGAGVQKGDLIVAAGGTPTE